MRRTLEQAIVILEAQTSMLSVAHADFLLHPTVGRYLRWSVQRVWDRFLDLLYAPPELIEDAVLGEQVIQAADIEALLERSRSIVYHPRLGLEVATFDIGGELRIGPADLIEALHDSDAARAPSAE